MYFRLFFIPLIALAVMPFNFSNAKRLVPIKTKAIYFFIGSEAGDGSPVDGRALAKLLAAYGREVKYGSIVSYLSDSGIEGETYACAEVSLNSFSNPEKDFDKIVSELKKITPSKKSKNMIEIKVQEDCSELRKSIDE